MKDINEIKNKIRKILKKNRVVRAGIFGSYARGEQKKKSDIDVLIQFKGRKSLFDIQDSTVRRLEIIGEAVKNIPGHL